MSLSSTAGRSRCTSRSASSALWVATTMAPHCCSTSVSSSRASGSSSTSSTLMPVRSTSSSLDGRSAPAARVSGATAHGVLGAVRTGSRTRNVGALAVPSLSHRHGTAVQLDDVADDRQAETQAAVRALAAAVELAEAIEHERLELGSDAAAGVADLDDHSCFVFAREEQLDAAAGGRELDRVGQQVPDHLLQAGRRRR